MSTVNHPFQNFIVLCSLFNQFFNALSGHSFRVFWVNIVKSEVNLHYKNCLNLFEILKREIEFRYYFCQNSTKSMREKKKKVERKNVKFRQRDIEFPVPNSAARVRGVPEVKRKKKIDKLIVAMPLPK